MTRRCEICGSDLSDAGPFAICAKCLFEMALSARGQPTVEAHAQPEPIAGSARLFARRDFFQKYEILERVAQGGQGDIWKVWDFEFRRTVAMKRLAEPALGSGPAVYRFLAEAQIAGQLEHPGILPIFDVGLDPDGRPFYTTQLLPGTTLNDIWRRVHDRNDAEWTLNRALELLVRVCDVMAHAHSRGVIHRDLKPSNVLVGSFGDVRVIDWGSAHVLEQARKNFQTPFVPLNQPIIETDRAEALQGQTASPLATAKAGQPITALFMPPEVLRGDVERLGPQTDVYSVGVMLYQLLADRPPYSNPDGSLPDPTELRERIVNGCPTPLRKLNRSISRDLAAICHKAMTPAKTDRYPTMQELGDDLRAALEVRPVQARKPGPFLRLQKWAQRNTAHVLLASVTLMIGCAAFFIVRGLMAERDVARQLTALRSAELSARSGQWRDALRHWGAAESAGYTDSIHLGLRRAEAWTVLSSPRRAWAELDKLVHRSDLADRRGVVLLRVGEHELFDKPTFERGVRHVREALASGLTGADRPFAKALLADSTPEALDLFRQALQFDPYHHSAHRHSLGLEYLLGRHQELAAHVRVFRVLFPDDPSPGFLEAAELAVKGRLHEAEACLGRLRGASNPEIQRQLMSGFQMLAATAEDYDVEVLLGERKKGNVSSEQLSAASFSDFSSAGASLRVPELPCIQLYREGWNAVNSLAVPLFADSRPAIEKVKSSWRSHPEALLPVIAGTLLETRQPRQGPKSIPLLVTQAELFQMGSDSPSILPGLSRFARFRAATAQFELARSEQTNSLPARRACVENIRRASVSDEISAAECRACFEMAFELADHDLARALLNKWAQRWPGDQRLVRSRIRLELASGAFGEARKFIDQFLKENPGDQWALEQREVVKRKLKELIDTFNTTPNVTH